MYYALVWSSMLDSKRRSRVIGKEIGEGTELPKSARLYYGTSDKDYAKIRYREENTEIEYDVYTGRQSVRYWNEYEEYDIKRDVRLVIWEGSSELGLPRDRYLMKVISIRDFEIMVADIRDGVKGILNVKRAKETECIEEAREDLEVANADIGIDIKRASREGDEKCREVSTFVVDKCYDCTSMGRSIISIKREVYLDNVGN